jgi:pectate lyase
VAYLTGSTFNRSHFAGNAFNGQVPEDPWSLVRFREGWSDEAIRAYKQTQPFETGPVATMDFRTAYQHVLDSGGATRPKRDAADVRIVNDVKNRTGRIIKSQTEVGGWPTLASEPAPADRDRDGMPDAWEIVHGLDPDDPSDRNAIGPSGYTRLEEYLNQL